MSSGPFERANTSSIDTRALAVRAAELSLSGHLEPSTLAADELSVYARSR